MRQEKGVRLAQVLGPDIGVRGEVPVPLLARRDGAIGVAHHAPRDQLGVDAGAFGERALHEQLADTHAKRAADELGEQEAPRGIELIPPGGNAFGLHIRSFAA